MGVRRLVDRKASNDARLGLSAMEKLTVLKLCMYGIAALWSSTLTMRRKYFTSLHYGSWIIESNIKRAANARSFFSKDDLNLDHQREPGLGEKKGLGCRFDTNGQTSLPPVTSSTLKIAWFTLLRSMKGRDMHETGAHDWMRWCVPSPPHESIAYIIESRINRAKVTSSVE